MTDSGQNYQHQAHPIRSAALTFASKYLVSRRITWVPELGTAIVLHLRLRKWWAQPRVFVII